MNGDFVQNTEQWGYRFILMDTLGVFDQERKLALGC